MRGSRRRCNNAAPITAKNWRLYSVPKTAGTVVLPGMEIRDRAEIDLGGRIIEVTAHAPSHTVCDVSLFDKNTGTLLPADLVFVGRMPSLDGSLRGWIKTLDALKNHAAARAVPGHGPVAVDWPLASAAISRYLTTLERTQRRQSPTELQLTPPSKPLPHPNEANGNCSTITTAAMLAKPIRNSNGNDPPPN